MCIKKIDDFLLKPDCINYSDKFKFDDYRLILLTALYHVGGNEVLLKS